MSQMRRFLSFRDFDWALLSMVLALCTISVLEIYSATLQTRFAELSHQADLFIVVGMILMFILAKIDYHRLIDWAPWAYGVCLVALIAVKLVGQRRWAPGDGFRSGRCNFSHPNG